MNFMVNLETNFASDVFDYISRLLHIEELNKRS